MITDDYDGLELVLTLIAALGALNWGLIELFDTNLLIDVLGLAADGDPLMWSYTIIGVAGAIVLIDLVDDSEVLS
jgi:uncharacterized membrane protein YuzA (DUF378 family)